MDNNNDSMDRPLTQKRQASNLEVGQCSSPFTMHNMSAITHVPICCMSYHTFCYNAQHKQYCYTSEQKVSIIAIP